MKSFLFENISMISHRDRKAESIEFDPKKNLIIGRNHTGKSSIVKTIFLTLGARPTGNLAQWDPATISVVTFTIEGRRYRALHQTDYRALYDEKGKLLAVSDNHQEWSEAFATTVGFNLVLTDKKSQTVPADARCFFLPFYINQDGSWYSSWETFAGLQQYNKPVGAILEYFSGIKPPAYYEIDSMRVQSQIRLEELRKEHHLLMRARERFSKSMPLSGPKVTPEAFEQDIAYLTAEVTNINKQQETLRDEAVRESELLSSVQLQIELAATALAIYDRDAKFLGSQPKGPLVCPTCNAEHTETFLNFLTYADDARILRELCIQLGKDAAEIRNRHRKTQAKLRTLEENYRRVSDILNVRRGELQFGDVVNSMGAESAFRTFEAESAALK
jgi:hypothetical protein